MIAASLPPADLLAHHRALGLGPERIYCPAAPSATRRLAGLVLDDDALIARIRADRALRRILFAYKEWRNLGRRGEVLIAPYVPRARIVRDVSTHGIVNDGTFAPLLFADQIVRGFRFRGSLVGNDWCAEETATVRAALERIAGWLRSVGFVGALAGIDGLLLRGDAGPEFVALDPNARSTATVGPWAVVAELSERAGRRFVWQLESVRIVGSALTVARLRRRLGYDLLDGARLAAGGVLPSSIASPSVGGVGASWMTAVLLAHDRAHLEQLRRRTRAALGGFG